MLEFHSAKESSDEVFLLRFGPFQVLWQNDFFKAETDLKSYLGKITSHPLIRSFGFYFFNYPVLV